MSLTAFALTCSLKPSPAESSTEVLTRQLLDAMAQHDVASEVVRAVDHDIKPGVSSDEGDGDEWPGLREKVLAADIVVLATPIWMGQPSSVCKRVLERMDAFLGEEDDRGRMVSLDKVAVVVTVGNEDGAHAVAGNLYQALSDVGFTIPPSAQAYWVGEAMGSTDYKDLDEQPEKVAQTISDLARNASHLAGVLRASPYPSGSAT